VTRTFGLFILLSCASVSRAADLTHAAVAAPLGVTGPERKAISLPIDAVRKRTRISWPVASANPGRANRS
jgi:hypothetical protein